MKAGEEPEPVEEAGDPACWAHLFEDDEIDDPAEDDTADQSASES